MMNVGAITGISVISENNALQRIMARLGMDVIREEVRSTLVSVGRGCDLKVECQKIIAGTRRASNYQREKPSAVACGIGYEVLATQSLREL